MSVSMKLPEYGSSLTDFYKDFLESKRGNFRFVNSVSGFGSVGPIGSFVSYNQDSRMNASSVHLGDLRNYSWRARPINGNVRDVHRHGGTLIVNYGIPEKTISHMRGLANEMRFHVVPAQFAEGYMALYMFDPSKYPGKNIENVATASTTGIQMDADNPIPVLKFLDAYWRKEPTTSWLWSVSGPDGI